MKSDVITLTDVRESALRALRAELAELVPLCQGDKALIERISRAQGYAREAEAAMAAEVSLIACGRLPVPHGEEVPL